MLFIDRLAEERREGFAEGQKSTILGLYRDGTISADIAASKLGITLDEFQEIVNEK